MDETLHKISTMSIADLETLKASITVSLASYEEKTQVLEAINHKLVANNSSLSTVEHSEVIPGDLD